MGQRECVGWNKNLFAKERENMGESTWVTELPGWIAGLNGSATIFLLVGALGIKLGHNKQVHKMAMMLGFFVSAAFLVLYLIYHAQVGHVAFEGEGMIRVLYFALLIPHVVLAAVQVPLILLTLRAAFQENWERHKKLAHWTFPIWLYVSVTGVVIYLMVFPTQPA